jgi:PDZ domain-containing protein
MNDQYNNNRKVFGFLWLSILLLVVGFGFLLHVPYYVLQAGTAMDTGEVISVDGGHVDKTGNFYLTTVSMKQANVFDYLYTKVNRNVELVPVKKVLSKDVNNRQYEQQQVENMLESQHSAVIVAFHQAKKPVTVTYKGVEVLGLTSGAKNNLQIGDIIQSVDGKSTKTILALTNFFKTRHAGETVRVGILRNKKQIVQNIKLIQLATGANGPKRVGLGFLPMDRLLSLTSKPKVNFTTNNLGGPSAGLMFTLEIMNQLTPNDLTHGYEIAGTGTVSSIGQIGQIGGVQHKIVAAINQHATIFFVPKDVYKGDDNELIAKQTAKKLSADIKVVPVATIQDAINYLNKIK